MGGEETIGREEIIGGMRHCERRRRRDSTKGKSRRERSRRRRRGGGEANTAAKQWQTVWPFIKFLILQHNRELSIHATMHLCKRATVQPYYHATIHSCVVF